MERAARYPSHAKIRLPAILMVTYAAAVPAESSDNLTESIAKVDIVVKAPKMPVPRRTTLPSLITVPAAMTPKRTPSMSDPTRLIASVAYGSESGPDTVCKTYLRTAPTAPPIATNASSLVSMMVHGN